MSKYFAEKTIADNIHFDSKKEMQRYFQLKDMQERGEISSLRLQVPYEIIPKQIKKNGKCERKCEYIADFVYEKDGETVVEDVKGYRKSVAYSVFAIKRKLMLQKYGIEVREI